MKPCCTNCLGIVKGLGPLCDKCVETAYTMYTPPPWPDYYQTTAMPPLCDDDSVDDLYTKMFKESRMKAYDRARRRARRGY